MTSKTKETNKLVKELTKPWKKDDDQLHNITVPSCGYLYLDIVVMTNEKRQNKGYNYILLILDAYSRMAWCVPLKKKTTEETTEVMRIWLKENDKKPNEIELITTDNGGEFMSNAFKRLMKEYEITHKTVEVGDHFSLGLVDRFVRTLRQKILAYWLENDTLNWIDGIDDIVREYNNTVHKTIDAKPISVWMGKKEPKRKIKIVDELEDGQHVRVLVKKDLFEKKSQTQNWSSNVYSVKEKDGNKYLLNEIDGRYARWQLLKTDFPTTKSEESGRKSEENNKVRNKQRVEREENKRERFLRDEGVDAENVIETKKKRERKKVDKGFFVD